MKNKEFRDIRNAPPSRWEDMVDKNDDAVLTFNILKKDIELYGSGINEKTKILDVGAGLGFLVEDMKKNGINAFGVDIRDPLSQESNVIAKVEKLPFANDSFDVIVAQGTFNKELYRQNQMLMFEEIKRCLKKRGLFILVGPGNELESLRKIIFDVGDLELVTTPNPFKLVYKKL